MGKIYQRPLQESEDAMKKTSLAQLSAGPQPATDLIIAGAMSGVSERTLKRAKKTLGVVSIKGEGIWQWSLPVLSGEA